MFVTPHQTFYKTLAREPPNSAKNDVAASDDAIFAVGSQGLVAAEGQTIFLAQP